MHFMAVYGRRVNEGNSSQITPLDFFALSILEHPQERDKRMSRNYSNELLSRLVYM